MQASDLFDRVNRDNVDQRAADLEPGTYEFRLGLASQLAQKVEELRNQLGCSGWLASRSELARIVDDVDGALEAQEREFGECSTGNLAVYTAEVPTSRLDDLARGS